MKKLLPFEKAILSGVSSTLGPELRPQFERQLEQINKVQRLLEWNEIEFYCMRWFKVRWPNTSLFNNHGEFVLGSGTLTSGGTSASVSVWAVGGHLFSIESNVSLKQFKAASSAQVVFSASATQQGIQADGSRRRLTWALGL